MKRFTIYDDEVKSVLQLLKKLGEKINEVIDSWGTKTDLYGDHKGSWQGLNRPTISEEGMRATVENHITEINNIKFDIDNIGTEMFVNKFGGKIDGSDTTTELQNYINYCLTNGKQIILPSGTIGISQPIKIKQNRVAISGGNRTTELKALAPMDSIIQINDMYTGETFSPTIIGTNISGLLLNGNGLARDSIVSYWTGQTKLENVTTTNCTQIGVNFVRGNWMFNFDHVISQKNGLRGFYIGMNCEGSSMRLCVAEENPINCEIGYTRMVGLRECTFQGFTGDNGGNLLLNGSWDVTVDTCWFEAPAYASKQPSGETYDIYNKRTDENGNIGHNNRFLNNSFHGCRTYSTSVAIIDEIGDSAIFGNYIDGSTNNLGVKSYTSGYWYKCTNANGKPLLLLNQVNGGQTELAPKYSMKHTIVGTDDDRRILFDSIRIADKIVMPQKASEGYTYDGFIYNNIDQKDLNFSSDGKMWRLMKVIKQGAIPTNGTWKTGDVLLNDTPIGGGYLGWVCVSGGTPGTWKGFGQIQS